MECQEKLAHDGTITKSSSTSNMQKYLPIYHSDKLKGLWWRAKKLQQKAKLIPQQVLFK